MTRTTFTFNTIVRSTRRRKNSINGNPRFVLVTDHGDYVTKPDISDAYTVSDSWADVPVELEVTRTHQVVHVTETRR